jgi:hypothetical protein
VQVKTNIEILCVFARNLEKQNRQVPCHLTNISIRLGGRKLQWDPVKEEIVGDPKANNMLKREQRTPYQTG